MLKLPPLLLLQLLSMPLCWGYGMEGCSASYSNANSIWCKNENIYNVSQVVQMITPNATEICLSRNKIQTIPPEVFLKLHRLKKLSLDYNKISSLTGGEFKGLWMLELLDCSGNIISKIALEPFQDLKQLKTLILNKNQISEIPTGFFTAIPLMQTLDLSWNKLKYVDSRLYNSTTLHRLLVLKNNITWLNVSGFPALDYIDISNNSLLHLQSGAFAFNPRLTDLLLQGVGANSLAEVSVSIKRTLLRVSFSVSIERPNVSVCSLLRGMDKLIKVFVDMGGSKLNGSALLNCPTPNMMFLSNADLGSLEGSRLMLDGRKTTQLYLVNCRLTIVSNTTFQGLETLQTLQLNGNEELNIVIDSFAGLGDLAFLSLDKSGIRKLNPVWFLHLKNLTKLSIMYNKITELPRKAFSALCNLELLFLRDNVLKYITEDPFSNLTKLEKLDLSLNIISFIEKGTFKDLRRLKQLNLSGNRIKTVHRDIFQGLGNMTNLLMSNNLLHFSEYDSPFSALTALENMDLRNQGQGEDGEGQYGQFLFKGLTHLKSLTIGYTSLNNFHTETFSPLVRLEIIYFKGITMSYTNLSTIFHPLKALIKLTLSKTDLDFLPNNLLPAGNSLKVLLIQSNHLHVLEKSLIDNLPMLQYLDIKNNPLSCSCQNAWFKNWSMHNPNVQVVHMYGLHCDNVRMSPYLWQFDDKACTYDQISFCFFLSTALVDIFCVCVCFTWHTQRFSIRYLLLLVRARLRGHKAGKTGRFHYDAFISYSSKDEPWVMEELVPRLEGKEFRLCLHHRDFRPGTAILENIEAAIYNARRTICVVTRDFLHSQWCALEFQLASLRLLWEGKDVLLLVFLEEIPNHCLSPYARIRKMVCKKTYLLWPKDPREQEAFWVRLQDALRERVEEEEYDGGQDGFAQLVG